MQIDFHYYASLDLCYSAQFVDCCTRTLLSGIGAPESAATTQLQLEMMEARTDLIGLQDITRIWASFHFLPYDLHAEVKKGSKVYKDKYRLICNTNSDLLVETVGLAKDRGLQAAGLAMHILADTWAHRYFAGTPSMVINNTNDYFYELIPEGDGYREEKVQFRHNPAGADQFGKYSYINTLYQLTENSVMCLGHGRAGHLPDYSFMRYRYLPAWGNYEEIIKDNPSDYYHAFTQMIYALKFLRGEEAAFEKEHYDLEAAGRRLLSKRSITTWKRQLLTRSGSRRSSRRGSRTRAPTGRPWANRFRGVRSRSLISRGIRRNTGRPRRRRRIILSSGSLSWPP